LPPVDFGCWGRASGGNSFHQSLVLKVAVMQKQ